MNMYCDYQGALEHKFARLGEDIQIVDGVHISGYASLFGHKDKGGDVVAKGAYKHSLRHLEKHNRSVKMLWQHDPSKPIGVWDEVYEDEKGLFVKGRILSELKQGREAITLIEAGAIDGRSIGYRTLKAHKDKQAQRILTDLELWEVSLVTFPMLPEARLETRRQEAEAKSDNILRDEAADILSSIKEARQMLRSVIAK